MNPDDLIFPPLTDADGRTFRHVPCQEHPDSWDEEASPEDQAAAAWYCVARCPALTQCRDRAIKLGPLATGVWGGQVRDRPPDTGEEDPQVLMWATEYPDSLKDERATDDGML